MIGMHLGASDNTRAVDKKPAGHGELPGVVTIESLEIDAEFAVHFLEFFGHRENQTKFICIFVIFIDQDGVGELVLFDNLFRIFT